MEKAENMVCFMILDYLRVDIVQHTTYQSALQDWQLLAYL